MPSRIISLSLKNINNWQVEDDIEADISNNYRQETKVPKVGWTINAVPSVRGIKSADLYAPENPRLLDLIYDNGLGATYAVPFDDVELAVDKESKQFYQFSTRSYEQTDWRTWLLFEEGLSEGINYPAPPSNINDLITNITLFQNRSLILNYGSYDNGDLLAAGAGNDVILTEYTLTSRLGGSPKMVTRAFRNSVGWVGAINQFKGIASFGNFVLLWTQTNELFWSDPNDFKEFRPDPTVVGSLAGSTKITELRGGIIAVVPDKAGFMVYGTKNIVHGAFSGDTANPWVFREVTGSSGIVQVDRHPVVTFTTENAAFHVALLEGGLSIISSDGVRPMPDKLRNFINTDYLERKAVGTKEITRDPIAPSTDIPSGITDQVTPKIKQVFLYGDDLFLCMGESSHYTDNDKANNRLYYFNFTSGQVGVIDGYCRSVVPYLNFRNPTSPTGGVTNVDEGNTSYHQAGAYLVSIDEYHNTDQALNGIRNYVLNLNSRSDKVIPVPSSESYKQRREGEVFLTSISISPDRLTEVLEVKLVGNTTDEFGGNRARIFFYSDFQQAPVEFQYYAEYDSYKGFVVGKDLQMEIRGHYFDLSDCKIEIQDGGRI